MKLYDNAFSPFARKVRMVLEFKGLAFDVIDGLRRANHGALAAANPRVEVPALEDGGLTVVNSADIVAYLEHKFPEPAVYPADPATRARARAWERASDSLVDPILVDISYWTWAERPDAMPEGMIEAARQDLALVYDALERALAGGDFICGEMSIADIALVPHLTAVRALDVPFSNDRHPRLAAWLGRMRELEVCKADRARARAYVRGLDRQDIERTRIFWRGDRVEWLLARGFHEWFMGEIEAGRVAWPGIAPPQG